jgi:hypothetical protein
MNTKCSTKCLIEISSSIWHSFWFSLFNYLFLGLTCDFFMALRVFGYNFLWFQDMSTLYTDSHGRTRKRSKAEVVAAIERISHRKIVIECAMLKSNIRVHPFQFIYQIFQENGWLSLFDAVNIIHGLSMSSTRT